MFVYLVFLFGFSTGNGPAQGWQVGRTLALLCLLRTLLGLGRGGGSRGGRMGGLQVAEHTDPEHTEEKPGNKIHKDVFGSF